MIRIFKNLQLTQIYRFRNLINVISKSNTLYRFNDLTLCFELPPPQKKNINAKNWADHYINKPCFY
jgi:hypothetical protein